MKRILRELYDSAANQTSLLDAEEKVSAKELAANIPKLSDRELLDLWEEAAAAASLMTRLRDAVGERINEQMALPVRDGNRFYTYGGYKRTKVIDPGALAAYVGDRWPEVVAMDRVRVTALDRLAEAKGDNPRTIRETFLDESWTGTKRLKAGPVDRAPEYMSFNAIGEARRESKR